MDILCVYMECGACHINVCRPLMCSTLCDQIICIYIMMLNMRLDMCNKSACSHRQNHNELQYCVHGNMLLYQIPHNQMEVWNVMFYQFVFYYAAIINDDRYYNI